jgi:Cu/Ag efflux pump CusA
VNTPLRRLYRQNLHRCAAVDGTGRKDDSQVFVDFFIHRPVFATVCALMIILAGAVCIPLLPIELYPNLAPPQVSVTSTYVGANADTVEKAVSIPLE